MDSKGDTIGEKGIGFKSVFKVARQVKVQSEPFCFQFFYDGQKGLQMVTPYNAEFEPDLPSSVQTRITLLWQDENDFPKRLRELKDLPNTLLLFLRQIRRITISIAGDSSGQVPGETLIYAYEHDDARSLGTLKKSCALKGSRGAPSNTIESTTRFFIKKRTIEDLPADESRMKRTQADVVLAFPKTDGEEPQLEVQHTYAYLPMRKFGFNVMCS